MGYRYIGSKARIVDEIIEYVKKTATIVICTQFFGHR